VARTERSGHELSELAAHNDLYSGPNHLDPDGIYSVAASEMLIPDGRPVGTEVEAVAWYLER
jgi:hypothetical protein